MTLAQTLEKEYEPAHFFEVMMGKFGPGESLCSNPNQTQNHPKKPINVFKNH